FIYVPFNAVHAPHQTPESYKDSYASLPEPRRTYAGMLAAMDEAVGTILAALDQSGRRQNTLVIFSSDNGGPAPGRVTDNGPLRAGKATLYEGGVRVCACAAWPGHIPAGSTVSAPLHMVDWYPTLLKIAGAKLDQKLPLDGRDMLACLIEGKPSPHDAILLNTTPGNGAVRVGDWKLVINGGRAEEDSEPDQPADKTGKAKKKAGKRADGETVELFNLIEDRSEKNNLAEKNPDKVKELRAKLDAFAKEAVPPKSAPAAQGFKSPRVWGEKD
ncbi:MAG: sulfatase-like hydrolase/transferase, partial [Verrucomicrobia bacterium]|nr:sulfatase-like hydrolase/transferase [Verrucomicrobiota bacterium]